jgi:hypothetical protein
LNVDPRREKGVTILISTRNIRIGLLPLARRIEAFATAPGTGFLGGPDEYRTVAALDRTGATRLSFTVTDRVR